MAKAKKAKKKRTAPMECAKAIQITNRLFAIGCGVMALGILVSTVAANSMVLYLLVLPGMALMLCGYYFHTRWVICPHCGEYLGDHPQMLREVPETCGNCGKEL